MTDNKEKTPVFVISDLAVTYPSQNGDVHAVDHISYEVGKGEIMGIVGESGCGKSTQAYAAMGLLRDSARIDTGHVLFDGMDMRYMTGAELEDVRGKHVGMIFQNPMTCLNPSFTIGEQLSEPLCRHEGKTKAEAKKEAAEMLRRVGIADAERCMKRYPHELSGGMRQRVMIAMAVMCKPEMLIADEPTTALDVTAQAQILKLLKDLSREMGISMVFITHNFGVVANICDSVAVMYAGRIVEKGAVRDIFYNSAHPYTKAMLSAIPSLGADKGKKLMPVPGSPINPHRPPEGCLFHPRCSMCTDKCRTQRPPEVDLGGGHKVCCWCVQGKEQ